MVTTTCKGGPITGMAYACHYREPFRTSGSLSGRPVNASHRSEWPSLGMLPAEWQTEITDSVRRGTLDYVIMSYATPIAWHDSQTGWTVPRVHYSVTTSRHAGRVRDAVTYYGADFRE